MYTTLTMSQKNAKDVVMACVTLHNFMMREGEHSYKPCGYADSIAPNGEVVRGLWREEGESQLQPAVMTPARNHTVQSGVMRENLVQYFSGHGAVPWQIGRINRRQ